MTTRDLQQPLLFAGRRWAMGTAIVAALTIVQTITGVFARVPPERLALQLTVWLIETPLLIVVLSLAFDVASRRRLSGTRMLLGSLVIASSIGAAFMLMLVFVSEGLLGLDLEPAIPTSYPLAAVIGAVLGILLCGVWALAFVYPHSAEQAQLRALEAERLRAEAEQLKVSAEIARLRSQFEPHFLLNTLNAIAALVTQNPREARRLIGWLGDLLRDSLQDQEDLQTLSDEIAWLKRYAQILEARHGDSLQFDWDVPPEIGGVRMPRLLLQPLVENAVQHGALCRAAGGRVRVSAHVTAEAANGGAMLVCTVSDNGPGLPQSEPRSGAFGLRAVRRRLELKHPSAALRLHSSSDGTSCVLELPLAAGESA